MASHGGRRSASAAISSWCRCFAAGRGDDGLQLGLLGGQLVEVGVGLGVGGVDLVELLLAASTPPTALLDRLAHRLRRGRAAAPAAGSRSFRPGIGTASPSISLVDAGHDLQQRRLPEPFRPSTPIFAPGKKDRLMSFRICALRRHDLADAVHGGADVLGHRRGRCRLATAVVIVGIATWTLGMFALGVWAIYRIARLAAAERPSGDVFAAGRLESVPRREIQSPRRASTPRLRSSALPRLPTGCSPRKAAVGRDNGSTNPPPMNSPPNPAQAAETLPARRANRASTPTPIQAQAIPRARRRRPDGGAQTGTGKTAGFTLPMLQRLWRPAPRAPADPDPRAHPHADARARRAGGGQRPHLRRSCLSSMVMFGGVGGSRRSTALRAASTSSSRRRAACSTTSGQRTLDLARRDPSCLDEADRMLDMGFIHDIKKVLALLPQRSRACCSRPPSATRSRRWPTGLLNNPAG